MKEDVEEDDEDDDDAADAADAPETGEEVSTAAPVGFPGARWQVGAGPSVAGNHRKL